MQPQSAWEVLSAYSAWFWPLTLDHVWQATVFAAVAAGVVWMLRNAPAHTRFWVWMVASAKFLVPAAFLVSLVPALGVPTPAFAHGLLWLFQSDTAAPALQSLPQAWWGLFTLSWLAGVLFFSLRWVHRNRRLAGRIREAREEQMMARQAAAPMGESIPTGKGAEAGQLDGPRTRNRQEGFQALFHSGPCGQAADSGREHRLLRSACRRMNIRRPVELLLSNQFSGPGVWGVRRPVLVLPGHMARQLEDAELESVFLHELAHVRRRDNLTAHLSMAVCCLFWFHPLVWWLNRQLLNEREKACDDLVLAHLEDSRSYANGLLKVVKLRMKEEVAGMAAAAGAPLGNRLHRILSGGPPLVLTLRHQAALIAAGAILLTLTALSPAKAPCPYAQQQLLLEQQEQKADEAAPQSESTEDGLLL